jgi:glycosyltransferase involved in cell wall biosynthesis
MRILMVNEKGWFFGGVEQLVNDVATGLAERGHEVALLSTEVRPEERSPMAAPFVSTAVADPETAPAVWNRHVETLLDGFDPDVVYVHRIGTVRHLDGLAAARPVIRYIHDHDVYCPRRHKYFPYPTRICSHPMGMQCVVRGCLVTPHGPIPKVPWLVNLPAKRAELTRNRALPRLCVGSRWMREMMLVNGFTDEQVTVLPPIPKGLDRPPAPMEEEPVVLFVGQVIRGKGVDLLLRALSEVKQPFRALIVGTGHHHGDCVALARELGLGDRVSFLGWVAHEHLAPLFERARVVVVPSRWPEPFGMVGLEAMWSARPVVGFAVGGIPDWLEDGRTGFAVAEQDWSAMAQAIDQLLADRDMARSMGLNGHRAASESFAFDAQIRATQELLTAQQESHSEAAPAAVPDGRA